MMLDNNFQPCIIAPTRIVSGNKPSLVDNIFINTVEKCISGNLFEKISDHMPNFVIFENAKDKPKRKITLKRDTKNFDAIKFQEDLRNKILTDIKDYENINESYEFFHISALRLRAEDFCLFFGRFYNFHFLFTQSLIPFPER